MNVKFSPGQRVRHRTKGWVGSIVSINAEAAVSMINQPTYQVKWDHGQEGGLVYEKEIEPE